MKLILLTTSLITIATILHADESKPSDSWFYCQKDIECIDIKYTCAGNTVNKAFEEIARKHYALENARSNCFTKEPTEAQKKIPYKVFCKNNKCSSQGINSKKPDFS